MLYIAESVNALYLNLKDLFIELGDVCVNSTQQNGSVLWQNKKETINIDPERVLKICQFGLQSLTVALPKTREERLRWRIPGNWYVKPHSLGEKWTSKHDSLLVVACLEFGENWGDFINDEEFGLGYKVIDEEGYVQDEVKSRQEYLKNLVIFRGNYNEEDVEVGRKLLFLNNMNRVEHKRAIKERNNLNPNKRKTHFEINEEVKRKCSLINF